jgi:hypothetical protein
MGARHQLALAAVYAGEQDLDKLLEFMRFALDECRHTSTPAYSDSAVALITWQMALVTGTDVSVMMNYREHIDTCVEEMNNDYAAFCASAGFN